MPLPNAVTIKVAARTLAHNLCATCTADRIVDPTMLSPRANLWPTNKRQLPVNI